MREHLHQRDSQVQSASRLRVLAAFLPPLHLKSAVLAICILIIPSMARAQLPEYQLDYTGQQVVKLAHLFPSDCHRTAVTGRIVKREFDARGIVPTGVVIQSPSGDRSFINIDQVTIDSPKISAVARGWILTGLRTMLNEGQDVSIDIKLCGAAGRVAYLDGVSISGAAVPPRLATGTQFDDAEAQLRVRQAANAAIASAREVDDLRKGLDVERKRAAQTSEERDLNRETIARLEGVLRDAEARQRDRETALKAAQDARARGLAAEAERQGFEDRQRQQTEEAARRKAEDDAPKKAAAGDFPVASCKIWNGTVVEKSGINTQRATLKGVVTKADVQEYCERDPGGMRAGGKLTVEQCISQIQQEIGRVELITTANCNAGTLTFRYGARAPEHAQFPLSKFADTSCASGMPPLIEQFKMLCPTAASRLLQ